MIGIEHTTGSGLYATGQNVHFCVNERVAQTPNNGPAHAGRASTERTIKTTTNYTNRTIVHSQWVCACVHSRPWVRISQETSSTQQSSAWGVWSTGCVGICLCCLANSRSRSQRHNTQHKHRTHSSTVMRSQPSHLLYHPTRVGVYLSTVEQGVNISISRPT